MRQGGAILGTCRLAAISRRRGFLSPISRRQYPMSCLSALSGMSPADVRREIQNLEHQIHELSTARSRRRTAEGSGLSRCNILIGADNSPYRQGVALVGLSDDAEFVGDSSRSGGAMYRFPMLRCVGVGLGAQNSFRASRGTDLPPTVMGKSNCSPVLMITPSPGKGKIQSKIKIGIPSRAADH